MLNDFSEPAFSQMYILCQHRERAFNFFTSLLRPYSARQRDLHFSAVISAGICRECQTAVEGNNSPPLDEVINPLIPLISSHLSRKTTKTRQACFEYSN